MAAQSSGRASDLGAYDQGVDLVLEQIPDGYERIVSNQGFSGLELAWTLV